MPRALSVLAVAAALAACTTLENLRASEPTAAGTFPGEVRSFAECVNFRLEDRVLVDPRSGMARVNNEPVSWTMGSGPADYELTIGQQTESQVRVELRERWTLGRAMNHDRVWSAVEACGQFET